MFNTDEKQVICSKGKSYQTYSPTDFEDHCGVFFWVKGDLSERIPITKKIFDKFFTTLDDIRDIKLNEILK